MFVLLTLDALTCPRDVEYSRQSARVQEKIKKEKQFNSGESFPAVVAVVFFLVSVLNL